MALRDAAREPYADEHRVADVRESDRGHQQRRRPDDCVNHAPLYRNPGTTPQLTCKYSEYLVFNRHPDGHPVGS